jgi:hypothetical protein
MLLPDPVSDRRGLFKMAADKAMTGKIAQPASTFFLKWPLIKKGLCIKKNETEDAEEVCYCERMTKPGIRSS